MVSYSATFQSGGTIQIKNSRREYAAAWKYLLRRADGSLHGNSGFSRDAELAERSARSEARSVMKHMAKPVELISVEVVPVERNN